MLKDFEVKTMHNEDEKMKRWNSWPEKMKEKCKAETKDRRKGGKKSNDEIKRRWDHMRKKWCVEEIKY